MWTYSEFLLFLISLESWCMFWKKQACSSSCIFPLSEPGNLPDSAVKPVNQPLSHPDVVLELHDLTLFLFSYCMTLSNDELHGMLLEGFQAVKYLKQYLCHYDLYLYVNVPQEGFYVYIYVLVFCSLCAVCCMCYVWVTIVSFLTPHCPSESFCLAHKLFLLILAPSSRLLLLAFLSSPLLLCWWDTVISLRGGVSPS